MSERIESKQQALSRYKKVPLKADMLLTGVLLHDEIDATGKFVGADGTLVEYYKLDDGGRHEDTSIISCAALREITINAVRADATPTVVTQLTDFHYNYCNDEDGRENNLWTMSTWHNRTLNQGEDGMHYSVEWHEINMRYADAVGDQMVITGDVIDYFSHGNLELLDRYIVQPYPDALITLGNHETTRAMGLPTDPKERDPITTAEYREMLQRVWPHDVNYTARVLNDAVMVIQFDNSSAHVSVSQLEKMKADFETARKNGYTVLLFAHDPFRLDNGVTLLSRGVLKNGMNLAEDINNETNRLLYDLFIAYSDVVRGFFTGHEHSDILASITGEKDGIAVSIPQFTLTGDYNSFGHILQITVK